MKIELKGQKFFVKLEKYGYTSVAPAVYKRLPVLWFIKFKVWTGEGMKIEEAGKLSKDRLQTWCICAVEQFLSISKTWNKLK